MKYRNKFLFKTWAIQSQKITKFPYMYRDFWDLSLYIFVYFADFFLVPS